MISNLGPGTKNCGISLVIHTLGEGTQFITKEFSSKDLIAEKGKFDLKIESNRMSLNPEGVEIQQEINNIKLFLSFKSDFKRGISLSGGKHTVNEPHQFVQADIAYSFQSAWGYLIQNGKKENFSEPGDWNIFSQTTKYINTAEDGNCSDRLTEKNFVFIAEVF